MPKLRLVAVDGHPLEVIGTTSCNIQLGGHTFLAEVIVMEALTEEGVLGLFQCKQSCKAGNFFAAVMYHR